MGLEEIFKEWEPTENNFRRAIKILSDMAGYAGYPGPEVGSEIWAARIVSDYCKNKDKSLGGQ